MPAPKKYERRISFTFNAEEKNLLGIKEIAYRERIPTGEKLNGLMATEIERNEIMQSQQQINPLGIVWNGILPQQYKKEPTEEEKKALMLKNLSDAVKEALPIIIYMEQEEFFKKVKGPIIDTIYQRRADRYNQQRQNNIKDLRWNKVLDKDLSQERQPPISNSSVNIHQYQGIEDGEEIIEEEEVIEEEVL